MVAVLLFYGMVVLCWSGWYSMIEYYSDGTATVRRCARQHQFNGTA